MSALIEYEIEAARADNKKALSKFLTFLAADIDSRPEHLKLMDAVQQARLRRLTKGIEVDLKQPLRDDCE